MPISPSPLVQGYMQQGQQPQGAPMSADQMFEKNFSDSAFAQLRSKFPQLMQYVVTFKVLDANVEDGRAFGAFVIQAGKNLRYVPIVMGNGAVTSSEMIYNKEEDSFEPLSADTVRKVTSDNMLMGGEILSGDAHVDDTKEIFRNMIRPPASSNVVIAGEHGLGALPNAAKEAVSSWLNSNPDVLAKIAATYDVAELASKLSQTKESSEKPQDMFVTVKEASAVKILNDSDRKTLLADGFLVKKAEENESAVASAHDIDRLAETELRLEEYVPQKKLSEDKVIRKAEALVHRDGGFGFVPCITFGGTIIFQGGKYIEKGYENNPSALVRGLSEEVTEEDLKAIGAKPIKQAARDGIRDYSSLYIAVPMRAGGWKVFQTFTGRAASSISGDEVFVAGIHATPSISYGFIKDTEYGDSHILVPANSLMFDLKDQDAGDWTPSAPRGLVRSFDTFRRLVLANGRQLTTRNDGPSVNIVDHGDNSSNNFQNKTAAARWLFGKFAMSHDQVKTVLDNYATVILEKRAFMQPPQVDPNTGMEMPVNVPQPGMMPQQITSPGGIPMQPQFDPNMVQAGVEVGGQDMIDTGILASFAQDPDIKALLVDYMPDFLRMLDKLGRVILLLCLEKKDMEQQYGMEKYADLLASCRKMFKMLGDIVNQLKRYVNMA